MFSDVYPGILGLGLPKGCCPGRIPVVQKNIPGVSSIFSQGFPVINLSSFTFPSADILPKHRNRWQLTRNSAIAMDLGLLEFSGSNVQIVLLRTTGWVQGPGWPERQLNRP